MKTTEAIDAALLSEPKLVVMASAAMQNAMPVPLIMNTARRPNRSIAKKEMKQHKNFQVRAHAARILERLELSPRLSWKIVDA